MCKYCGETDGCKLTGGLLSDISSLTADDWRRVYEFMKYVEIPFIHSVIIQAQSRAGIEYTPTARSKRRTEMEATE